MFRPGEGEGAKEFPPEGKKFHVTSAAVWMTG